MFCPQCGKEVGEEQAYCQFCGSSVQGMAAASEPSGRSRTDWEERERCGFLNGMFLTIKGSLFSPTRFFRKMAVTGGIADPLLYAMIMGVIGIMTSYVWQILLHSTFQEFLPHSVSTAAGFDALGGIGLAVVALLVPFFVIASLFCWAGLLHLLLLLMRGANNGFEATFRAVAYGYGSSLFMAVPFCGGVIATVWSLVLAVIGLKEAHGTSGGKAAFAVLFPLILCCAAAVLVAMLVLGTVAASVGTMDPSPWK